MIEDYRSKQTGAKNLALSCYGSYRNLVTVLPSMLVTIHVAKVSCIKNFMLYIRRLKCVFLFYTFTTVISAALLMHPIPRFSCYCSVVGFE